MDINKILVDNDKILGDGSSSIFCKGRAYGHASGYGRGKKELCGEGYSYSNLYEYGLYGETGLYPENQSTQLLGYGYSYGYSFEHAFEDLGGNPYYQYHKSHAYQFTKETRSAIFNRIFGGSLV